MELAFDFPVPEETKVSLPRSILGRVASLVVDCLVLVSSTLPAVALKFNLCVRRVES